MAGATGRAGNEQPLQRETGQGPVKIKFVRPRPTVVNHDIFLLPDRIGDGTCLAQNAAKRGHNDLSYEMTAGQRYFIVVDGVVNDEGAFTLRIEADD